MVVGFLAAKIRGAKQFHVSELIVLLLMTKGFCLAPCKNGGGGVPKIINSIRQPLAKKRKRIQVSSDQTWVVWDEILPSSIGIIINIVSHSKDLY